MAVDPTAITLGYSAFCAGADENTAVEDAAEELGKEIAAYYLTAVAGPPSVGANIIKDSGVTAGDVEKALLSDFKALEAKESEILPLLPNAFFDTATAITNGLLGMSLNGLIPAAPATVQTTGYSVISGGNPTTLGTAISAAMGLVSPIATANALVLALTANNLLVKGMYVGTMPSPTGLVSVPPIPWFTLV